ncbi:MAG TPA: hypothetical protein VGA78_04505 [Gemmatimonadales bacterium]
MTGSNPMRAAETAPGGRGPAAEMPDPWGVRRAENLLTTLEGVLSARVVTTPLGEVSEIHILASSGLGPKQVVRNVESALLAHLGLKVDHRKISVAQTADVRPIEALERGAIREQVLRRSVLFEDLGVASAERAHRVVLGVRLTVGGRTERVEEEVADTLRARLEGAARATAGALEKLIERHTLAVEGVKVVEALDRTVVFVVVRGMGGRDSHVMTGTAEVRESAERAAVFAVLDATNRWVEARRSA